MLGNLIGGLVGGLFGGARTQAITDPLERQKQYARQMEERQANAAIDKMGNDTRNAIAAGLMDSSNKASNAASSAAKGINF